MENEKSGTHRYTNRLVNDKSPYLLQHAHNPVDWFPWGDEAFEKARTEDKPLLVSIGYATCHWCHVMAHESFEDEEVARLMNKEYVAIKVDREERPDVDNVYMMACQALTGRGGWPLNVFITPDGKPFYAGSYFPKNTRMGLPGFMEVMAYLANVWRTDRGRLLKGSEEIAAALQPRAGQTGETVLDEKVLKKGNEHLARSFDTRWGGFGEAPKFPSPHQLTFLLRWFKRSGEPFTKEMVVKTLNAMRDGGIFDQVGYGFHRYSVDAQWLVPHFEKMLYDQALLIMAYAEAYQLLGDERFARTVREVSEYVLRDMTGPEGGFYSAEDADSEGREGLFYVWKPEEVVQHLGKELGDIFCRYYDIRPGGNFEEGCSIPHMHMNLESFASRQGLGPAELREKLEWGRRTLFEVREKRVHPLKDDKILTSWNGLMIAALAKASQALGEPAYAEAAGKAAKFVLDVLRKPDGSFFRRYRHGHVAFPAYLDDYAFFAWGLIELYETVFDVSYLENALSVTETMIDLFWDKDEGGFFFSGAGNEELYTRSKEVYDGALPSGNSVAALNLLRLGRMTGRTDLEDRAERMFRIFGSSVAHLPKVYTQFLNAVDFAVGPSREIVIAGDSDAEAAKAMVQTIHRAFLPHTVLLKKGGVRDERLGELAPFVENMNAIDGEPAAYVCEQYACRQPVTKIEGLKAALA